MISQVFQTIEDWYDFQRIDIFHNVMNLGLTVIFLQAFPG